MAPPTSSSAKSYRLDRDWATDAAYLKAQSDDGLWLHKNACRTGPASAFIRFGESLGNDLCHNDIVADIGGNDGFSANAFYLAHKIRPIVVDCLPDRLAHADRAYRLTTVECFIDQHIPLDDNAIDWAFCSHTLEHVRDLNAAISEIARVVRRGVYFVVPIEDASSHMEHAYDIRRVSTWRKFISKHFKVKLAKSAFSKEAHIYGVPR